MIDLATILRAASAMGHAQFKGEDDTCPGCGLNADDMLKLGRIPRCDAGRWLAHATKAGS